MKPEDQRVAIAVHMGWKFFHGLGETMLLRPEATWPETPIWIGRGMKPGDGRPEQPLTSFFEVPDYLADLNAMHEAVQQFRYPKGGTLWAKNQGELRKIVMRDREMAEGSVSLQWECENATAIQRAEAFLRTLNLWTDGPG